MAPGDLRPLVDAQSALGFAQFPLERAMWLMAAMVVDIRGD
jgi:hypothetical protein